MKYCWIATVLFAFVLRLGAAWFWENRFVPARVPLEVPVEADSQKVDGPFFFGDSDSYWKLGRALAFGRSYQFDSVRHWTVFRMPGYPILLAPWFRVYGESPPTFPARIVNCVLGTICVGLVGLLASLLFRDRSVALLAGSMAAVEPCGILQSISILSEAAFSAVMLVQLILFVKIVNILFPRCHSGPENGMPFPAPNTDDPQVGNAVSWKWGAALGLTWAASVYLRPSWLYFVPFAFLGVLIGMVLFRSRCSIRKAIFNQNFWRLASCSLIVFCLLMAPWWIRNAQVTGRFVPTTLQLGASLYDGLSPQADGSSDMTFVDRFRNEEKNFPLPGTEKEHFEVRLDRRLKNASIQWSYNHPKEVLRLAGVKFCRLWNVVPNEPSFSSRPAQLIIFLSYTPILLLTLLALFLRGKPTPGWPILFFPAFYLTILHVIFVSSLRYRTPALFAFTVLAAWALAQICRRFGLLSAQQEKTVSQRKGYSDTE